MDIKFFNPKREFKQIYKNALSEIKNLFASNRVDHELEGYVRDFESRFAEAFKAKYAVSVDSGTTALQLSLLALGINKGDEVITVSNSYIATSLAISNIGAIPVYADIDKATMLIDPNDIENRITKKTKAIIPVHLYGHCADMKKINAIAKKNNLKVVEDACQAHGAMQEDMFAGTMSDLGCFSFFSSKNLSGFGNGGMVVSNDTELIEKVRIFKDPEADDEIILKSGRTPGYLDPIQVAIIKQKLEHITQWNELRKTNAKKYISYLQECKEITLPVEIESFKHCFHSFVIRTKHRDILKTELEKFGIETHVEYNPLAHTSETYKHLNYKNGDLPNTEKAGKQILSLPMSPYLKNEEIEIISKKILSIIKSIENE